MIKIKILKSLNHFIRYEIILSRYWRI